jgi:hypothetical protein
MVPCATDAPPVSLTSLDKAERRPKLGSQIAFRVAALPSQSRKHKINLGLSGVYLRTISRMNFVPRTSRIFDRSIYPCMFFWSSMPVA